MAQSLVENKLRRVRLAHGLTQEALASVAGVTRQAVCAIETDQYLPTTAVALRLARALHCRVEDLFSLGSSGEVIEGELVGPLHAHQADQACVRVKVARVGKRMLVRPVAGLGDLLNFTIAADGLLLPPSRVRNRAPGRRTPCQVRLLRDREAVDREVVVAGCDPAVFLLSDYVRRRQDKSSVVGWPVGSATAIAALKRGEVHIAGLHIVDPKSGESNVPYLRRHFKEQDVKVVTFASWEQGLMVSQRNPKGIRGVADLAAKGVRIINREPGAGARLLLDHQLTALGIPSHRIHGYERLTSSHLEVARLIAEGQADVGIGVGSAANLLGLKFLPLQQERYDLVIPTVLLDGHPTLAMILDTLVTGSFCAEIEALGGYDTRDTGRVVDW